MNKDIEYVQAVLDRKINAPLYVRKQCAVYKHIFDGNDEKYCINMAKRNLIIEITKLLYIQRKQSSNIPLSYTLPQNFLKRKF